MLFNDLIGLDATRHTGRVALRFGTAELSLPRSIARPT